MMNLAYISTLFLPSVELFSRAGGGGSSSGGSSGGAGSSWVVLVGYFPMFFLGGFLRKKLSIKTASIIGWILAPIYSVLFFFIFGPIYGTIIFACIIVGMGSGLYKWFDKMAKLAGVAKKKQEIAIQKDSAWETSSLNSQVTNTFNRYQTDWSNNDGAAMQPYMTPKYFYHSQLMIMALRQ